jgi:uncharacterized membrane protein
MEASRSPETGRYARRSFRDARGLYKILRAVAEAAVANRPTADPRKVKVREWRDARHLCESEFGHIPLPQEVRRQLAKLNGELLPFPELLSIAFGDRGSITRVHTNLRAEDEIQEWMSDRHVWYALRYVARSLAHPGPITTEMTILPWSYERERRRLIEVDMRRARPTGLAERLPTHFQIAIHAGTWDRALELAELAPRPQIARPKMIRRSLSVPEAIVRYYEVVGLLPTPKKLLRFRHDYGFSIEWQQSKVPLTTFFPAALALIAARDDLATPRPYDETKQLPVSWPLPENGRDPDHPARVRAYKRPELLHWVRRFVNTLGPGDAATYIGWAAFKCLHPEAPSGGTLQNHGGLPALVAEASHPDAIARAESMEEAKSARAAQRKLEHDLQGPAAEALVAAMRALGGAFVRQKELFAALDWSEGKVMTWLERLREGGIIELVDAGVGRKSYRYRLADLDLTEDETERLRFESEARAPSARQILETLDSHGPLKSIDIAPVVGLHTATVSYWMQFLLAGGFVERVGEGPRSKKGFRISNSGRALLPTARTAAPTTEQS